MTNLYSLKPPQEHNLRLSMPRPDRRTLDEITTLFASLERLGSHSLSPDGQKIVFLWYRNLQADIYILPVAGGFPQRITFDRPPRSPWLEEAPRWSPDGSTLAFTSGSQIFLSPASGSAAPRPLSNLITGAFSPRWMPDGASLVAGVDLDDYNKLVQISTDGAWMRQLTAGTGDDSDPQPSPDGNRLVFVHRPADDMSRLDLRLLDLSSGEIQLLSGAPEKMDWMPRWSPDGKTLAYLSNQSGHNELWMLNLEENSPYQLTHTRLDLNDIAWSPDGRWIAATLNRDGARDLFLIDSGDGRLVPLQRREGCHAQPAWSPQGDFITFEYSDAVTPPDFYRLELAGVDFSKAGKTAGLPPRPLTCSRPPLLNGLEMSSGERVRYKTFDGLEIPSFLFRPEHPNGAAVVYPHGGPRAQYVLEWDPVVQYLVLRGYTVLANNYRGSTGYGLEYEQLNDYGWGIGDTRDCLFAARYLAGLDGIDKDRIALVGASYGGYLAACVLARDPDYLFACGVSLYGFSDLDTLWTTTTRATRRYLEMEIGHPAENRAVYREGSSFTEFVNIKKPMLILHGLSDTIVAPASSEEMVNELRRLDKPFEYTTYEGEAHGFCGSENLLDMYARIQQFLDWHLMP